MPPVLFIVVLGIAGACGAVARYAVAGWVLQRWRGRFPLATFLINVSGAFALGLLLTAGGASNAGLGPYRALLGTGFLGGYTTFSTLSFETDAIARRGVKGIATANALLSLCAGVVAAAAGVACGLLL